MTTVKPMSDEELGRETNDEPRGFGGLRCARGLLPMEAMDVRASITGLAASIQVSQTFRNTLSDAMEVTYIFPLPPRAAVSSFKLEVAGRIIEGIIKERGQARRDYQQAIDAGKRAAITEEDRSGVFTMRAGNIMPGEVAVVHLELVGPLAIEDGDPCFRFPLVVAPRYMPGSALDGASVGDGVAVDTDQVPDASRISPPVLLAGCKSPIRLSMEVDIDTGDLPLSGLRSSLHAVITEERAGRTCVRLQPGERLNRDFILRFGLGAEDIGTQFALCKDSEKHEDGNDGTIALTIVPPKASAPSRPRDVIFVLDRSGSMGGWKMVAARRAVGRMLDTLGDSDRYNVYAFDNSIETPDHAGGEALIKASDRNRFRTIEWLAGVDARGGTEMLSPISRSFGDLAGGYQERDRMMVLITDGQVGNEDHILRSVQKKMRNVRVFTIGIDQAVNEGFLRRLAVMGGGSCALVESEDRLDDVMAHIHRRISTPVITELKLAGKDIKIDYDSIVPRRLPDLYEGSPTTMYARYRGASTGTLRLSGSDAIGMPFELSIEPRTTKESSLHSIWARGRVRDLEDRYAVGDGDLKVLEKQILGVSLGFSVLSRFTAFVAVDHEEVVNPGGEGTSVVQPVESPEGWLETTATEEIDGMAFFGAAPMPQTLSGAIAPACAAPAAAASPTPGKMRARARPRLFSKKLERSEEPILEEESAKPEEESTETLDAYKQRLRDLIERASKALDAQVQLRILLQGLKLLLDDLESVHAPASFITQLSKALTELRALWSDAKIGAELAKQISVLEALSTVEHSMEPTQKPERRGFWK